MGKQRSHNYEVLRILCMFCIVFTHVSGYLRISENEAIISCLNANIIYSILKVLSVPMVNTFVLLSGYFLISSDFKLERIVRIYSETVFYLLCGTLISICLGIASYADIVKSILFIIPSQVGKYWFIRMYILLLLLQPFICRLVTSLTKKNYLLLLFILIFYNTHLIGNFPLGNHNLDPFSNFWFITVFLIGGFLRIHVDLSKIQTYKIFISVLIFGCLIFIIHLNRAYFIDVKTNSLLSLVFTVSVFLLFGKWHINNKLIPFVSQSVFAVYIIHEMNYSKIVLNNVLTGNILYTQPLKLLIYAVLCSTIIFIVGILADKLRIGVFQTFNIENKVLIYLRKIIWHIKKQG